MSTAHGEPRGRTDAAPYEEPRGAPRRDPGALVVLANFVSPLAVDLREESVLRQWARQAPRKVWLARPGDVLVLPAPLGDAFRRYAFERLGIAGDRVTVVTVPETARVPMAEAAAVHGLLEPLRALVRERPGARLLPTALDEAAVALAAALGTPVVGYEAGGPGPGTLRAVADLNTKSGFRAAAGALGIRLPPGRVCGGAELARVLGEALAEHGRVVLKPDRSAGGHGLRFMARGNRPPPEPPPDSRWVVERYVAHTRAVSAQGFVHGRAETRAGTGVETGTGTGTGSEAGAGVRVLFDGEMRMSGGSFAGYHSPPDLPEATRAELAQWTRRLGGRLAEYGYRGPFSLDAVRADDGTLYALESNVRRTATTTAHAMVTRLTEPGTDTDTDTGTGIGTGQPGTGTARGAATGSGRPPRAWSTGTVHTPAALPFGAVAARLAAAGLDFRPGDGEGVLLFTDRPVDGTGWRYTALAPAPARLAELEAALTAALGAA